MISFDLKEIENFDFANFDIKNALSQLGELNAMIEKGKSMLPKLNSYLRASYPLANESAVLSFNLMVTDKDIFFYAYQMEKIEISPGKSIIGVTKVFEILDGKKQVSLNYLINRLQENLPYDNSQKQITSNDGK